MDNEPKSGREAEALANKILNEAAERLVKLGFSVVLCSGYCDPISGVAAYNHVTKGDLVQALGLTTFAQHVLLEQISSNNSA